METITTILLVKLSYRYIVRHRFSQFLLWQPTKCRWNYSSLHETVA